MLSKLHLHAAVVYEQRVHSRSSLARGMWPCGHLETGRRTTGASLTYGLPSTEKKGGSQELEKLTVEDGPNKTRTR